MDAHRSLAHDLKAPLCAMQLNAEAALRTLGEGPGHVDAARRLAAILRQVAWMGELVDAQLLGAPLEEVLPVMELVRVGVERLRPLAEARRATLHQACDGASAVRVRTALVQQVLANLVVNALEHGPAQGSIWVEAGPSDGAWVRLRVRDEGPPLSAEVAARLMEPGRKGASSGGQGLGLAIAAEAVRAHGGRLWQEPGAPAGNAFAFTLPAA
jgi:signal transduction histidine kinase